MRWSWGKDRVFYHDQQERLKSLPLSWTSLAAEDPFVSISAGRAFFRVEDLIRLAEVIDDIQRKETT